MSHNNRHQPNPLNRLKENIAGLCRKSAELISNGLSNNSDQSKKSASQIQRGRSVISTGNTTEHVDNTLRITRSTLSSQRKEVARPESCSSSTKKSYDQLKLKGIEQQVSSNGNRQFSSYALKTPKEEISEHLPLIKELIPTPIQTPKPSFHTRFQTRADLLLGSGREERFFRRNVDVPQGIENLGNTCYM